MDTSPTLSNALTSAAAALLVSWWSYRRSLLSASGATAAALVGALTFASGWSLTWALLLFFLSSALLSRLTRKRMAKGSLVEEQSAPRNAGQVLAVGATVAFAALLYTLTGNRHWLWGGFGSLSFATADTWATDVGQTSTALPRLLGWGKPVEAGRSGGVTLRGTCAAFAGAMLIALVARVAMAGSGHTWYGTLAIGFGGSTLDSVLGALGQMRGQCSMCGADSEKWQHCGAPVRIERRGLSNEGVNLVVSGLTMGLGLWC